MKGIAGPFRSSPRRPHATTSDAGECLDMLGSSHQPASSWCISVCSRQRGSDVRRVDLILVSADARVVASPAGHDISRRQRGQAGGVPGPDRAAGLDAVGGLLHDHVQVAGRERAASAAGADIRDRRFFPCRVSFAGVVRNRRGRHGAVRKLGAGQPPSLGYDRCLHREGGAACGRRRCSGDSGSYFARTNR